MHRGLLLATFVFTVLSCHLSVAQESRRELSGSKHPWPEIHVESLSNPHSFGIAFLTESDKSIAGPIIHPYHNTKLIGMGYRLDALIPFDNHPRGHIVGSANVNINWLPGFENVSSSERTVRRRYHGSLSLLLGELEIGRLENRWDLRKVNVGLELSQNVPGSMLICELLKPKGAAGATPLVIRTNCKYSTDASNLSADTTKIGLNSFWQIPTPIQGLYLFPQGELEAQEKDKPRSFFMGEIIMFIGESLPSNLPEWLEPILFARYVAGRQAPEYIHVDGWEFGTGTSVLF